MTHLHLTREPRIGERFVAGRDWQITAVTHHGGTQDYTIRARPVFSQFPAREEREFTGTVRLLTWDGHDEPIIPSRYTMCEMYRGACIAVSNGLYRGFFPTVETQQYSSRSMVRRAIDRIVDYTE